MNESKLLKKYSQTQIINAKKLADKLKNIIDSPLSAKNDFITDYLEVLNTKYFWFDKISDQASILRLYNRYFYFDGVKIWFYRSTENCKPNPKNISKAHILKYRDKILNKGSIKNIGLSATTFSKNMSELATEVAVDLFEKLKKKQFNEINLVVHKHDFENYSFSEKKRISRYFHYRRKFLHGVTKFFLRIINFYLKQFNATLNQELLKTIRSVRCPKYKLYNWLASGNSVYRLQLLKAQPLLVSYLLLTIQDIYLSSSLTIFHKWLVKQHLDKILYPWHELNQVIKPTITRKKKNYEEDESLFNYKIVGVQDYFYNLLSIVADNSLPFNQILSFITFKSKNIIKAIGKVNIYHVGGALSYYFDDDAFNNIFTGLTLGNIKPNSKKEWLIWFEFFSKLQRYDIKNWPTFFAGIKQPFTLDKKVQYLGILADLQELTACIKDRKLWSKFHSFLSEKSTLLQIKKITTIYHRYEAEARDQLMIKYGISKLDISWSPYLLNNNIQAPNGLIITELTNNRQLELEGWVMNHCVGGYYYSTLQGDCRIISIRENNNSLATAELIIGHKTLKDGKQIKFIKCNQFRGYGNSFPCSAADLAFKWFMKQIKSKKILTNVDWPNDCHKIESIEKIQQEKRQLITKHLKNIFKGYF